MTWKVNLDGAHECRLEGVLVGSAYRNWKLVNRHLVAGWKAMRYPNKDYPIHVGWFDTLPKAMRAVESAIVG